MSRFRFVTIRIVPRVTAPLAIVLLAAACSVGTQGESPSASPSVSLDQPPPSASLAAASLSPSPSSAPVGLPRDSVAQVVTTDLVVRSSPGVGAESEIYPERLNEPMRVFVVDGPVRADGFDWYLVDPMYICVDVCLERPRFGWVAEAGKDGETWIAAATIDCPAPHPDSLGWLSTGERLACFGNAPLTLDGTVGDCYAAETPVAWKQRSCVLLPPNYVLRDTFERFLSLYAADGVQIPRTGTDVRVIGHFDDPMAETCAVLANPAPDFGLPPVPAEQAVLSCRGDFVVTSIELLAS